MDSFLACLIIDTVVTCITSYVQPIWDAVLLVGDCYYSSPLLSQLIDLRLFSVVSPNISQERRLYVIYMPHATIRFESNLLYVSRESEAFIRKRERERERMKNKNMRLDIGLTVTMLCCAMYRIINLYLMASINLPQKQTKFAMHGGNDVINNKF